MSRQTLGIVTNDPHNVFQRTVIDGVHNIAQQSGYEIAVFRTEPGTTLAMLPFNPAALAGLLVIANILDNAVLRALHNQGVPLSLVSHRVPNAEIPVVAPNNQQGIAALVSHLTVRCNRRNIVFIRGLADQSDTQERELAFRQQLVLHDLYVPPSHYLRGDFSSEIAADSVRGFLRSGIPFDSIIASDYVMAIAATTVLREAGCSVPSDVSVVGFGDSPEAEAAGLTTVAASIVELGMRAARQLISQIQGRHISGLTILSVQLRIRATCGCA